MQADGLIDASMSVKITGEMLRRAPNLRIISCATTGSDHIAKDEAASRGIEIRTLREDPELLRDLTPAAELSWALVMACARRLVPAVAHVRQGKWQREQFPGMMLRGRTLGLVGCGRIGQWMARYAQRLRHARDRLRSHYSILGPAPSSEPRCSKSPSRQIFCRSMCI